MRMNDHSWASQKILEAPSNCAGAACLQSRHRHPPAGRVSVNTLSLECEALVISGMAKSGAACCGCCHSPLTFAGRRAHLPSPSGTAAGRRGRSFTACAGRTIEFCKYQGLGNDFILVRGAITAMPVFATSLCAPFYNRTVVLQVDNRHQREPVISPEQAARVCDRNFGVGGDGVRACLLLATPLGRACCRLQLTHRGCVGHFCASERERRRGLRDAHLQLRWQRA